MPASTDLKAAMADCWKTVWKVDPLPLSVPLRLELLLADAVELLLVPVDALLLLDDELDEEHAARATAQTASPAVVTCRLRRRCISGTPYRVYRVWAATSSPVILQTVVCQYSLAATLVLAGKCEMDKTRLKS
ncbi:MAG TPA: hypothetical protein VJ254_24075 [Streptosporangiaceae bacterium]|nr:hypothetical protein [Streptosporangiaceae bacterium]